jgi:hypothetical protein
MIGWILFLAVLTILSYLTDVGVITFFNNLKVPFFNASILSVLLLFCTLGILIRMLSRKKKGEKEKLLQKINELERTIGPRSSQP